jgi:hypothetical protein
MTKGPMLAVAARGAKLTITLTARAKVTFSVVRRQTGSYALPATPARGKTRSTNFRIVR